MSDQHVPILIVGGSVGGCAAAIAAASLGQRVILTEETDWIGGQLTSQAVPPDEHPWIEQFGCTRRYRAFRNGVRQYYRDHYPLSAEAREDPHLNPGEGWVSQLCHEPRVALAVIESMLMPHISAGRIEVRLRRQPVSCQTNGDRITAVTFHVEGADEETISADFVLDATELGDLLPLAGVEYVTGAESQRETGEPHAVEGDPQPETVQAFTWCFPLAWDPLGEHVIDKPAQHETWRDYQPQMTPPYAKGARLLSWITPHYITGEPREWVLFDHEASKEHGTAALWPYRRIIGSRHYADKVAPHEVTLVNWPQNDYWEGNLIDKSAAEVARHLQEARQLSLSFVYWLQTEAPRPDGGTGYPGLYLRPDLVGTSDGLAKTPYIRESRRIRALFTVTENHVAVDARPGKDAAETFDDSVGVGCYRIDLHPSTGLPEHRANYIDASSYPFQIPLGSLIPVRVENLLPACKNLGVTHLTNGCYRLHPVEWNIGESVGLLAAFCLEHHLKPRQVREQGKHLADFQALLRGQGIELQWPRVHAV